MNKHEWLLKRNCSLAPRQLAIALAVPCFASLLIALWFLWHGAWHVLAFVMLESAAVACAFCHYARHATDREHIALDDGYLLIEQCLAGEVRQIRLDPYWTRVAPPDDTQDLINLEAKGIRIAVGLFVTEERRRQVALELRAELNREFRPAA
ncbi:DUF2244 domain-containing protein [Herbaspirillum sp. ST 5-3]|uniref:DUF2244 domain-containing protein n=1 Tax=Oxalobacteraceae TaxID=75682 RepID=UPI0010A2CDA3|nr:DUF2244 domain-containing protein [Herbaspirillum sp. ST 5-3]